MKDMAKTYMIPPAPPPVFAQTPRRLGAFPVRTRTENALAPSASSTDKTITGKEAYRLTVSPKGIVVAASQPAGLFFMAL